MPIKVEFRNPGFRYVRKIKKKKRFIEGSIRWPIAAKSHFNHTKKLGRKFKMVKVRKNRGRFTKALTYPQCYYTLRKKKLTNFFYKTTSSVTLLNIL